MEVFIYDLRCARGAMVMNRLLYGYAFGHN